MTYNSLNTLPMEKIELFEKKFSILQNISSFITVTDNISAIANLMLDLAVNFTNAEKGSIMLLNEQGELYILAARGIDVGLMHSYRAKMGEGVAGTVAMKRTAVLVADIEEDDDFRGKKRDRYKTNSFISCPILCKNRLLGVLNINDKRDNEPFTGDEFELIKIIANQAAIALENALLMHELKAKAADLEEINKKLVDVDAVKTEFLMRVSHELRTPLNSINGAIYYLENRGQATSKQEKEFYDIISHETNKLIAIVENLLDFLRLEDETQLMKKSVIDLPVLLNEIVNSTLLKTSLVRRNIRIELDMKEVVANIVGDKMRVFQFFMNAIEGLGSYLGSDDSIRITVEEDTFVRVRLILSKSLPESLLRDLFNSQQMYQIDQSGEKLKLYLAWKVAETHRWEMHAENRDGTCHLTVTIPKSARQNVEAVMDATLEMFTDFVAELLGVNICSIMLLDELTGDLSIKSSKGLDDEIKRLTRIKIGDRIAGWVALEGKPLLIEDVENDPRFGKKNIPQYNTKSLISLPLKIHDKVVGVINLNNKKTGEPFTTRDLSIISSVSDRISYFMGRLYSGEYREEEVKEFVTSFDGLLSAEKKYRKKESLLPDLMLRIMNNLKAGEEEIKLSLYVSTIYDLGLTLIDDSLLQKKKLLQSEISTLQIHPYTSVDLINSFEISDDAKKAILHHHEKYDGTGYPDGLRGEEIPFISRVLSVVDAFCSMLGERPYRKAFTKNKALQEIKKGSGSAYDPRVVKALEEAVKLL